MKKILKHLFIIFLILTMVGLLVIDTKCDLIRKYVTLCNEIKYEKSVNNYPICDNIYLIEICSVVSLSDKEQLIIKSFLFLLVVYFFNELSEGKFVEFLQKIKEFIKS